MKTFVRQISTEDVDALIGVASDSWNWTYREIYRKDFIDNWIREYYSRESLLGEIKKI